MFFQEKAHSNICMNSIRPKHQPVELEAVKNFHLFDSLESVYPLLEIIFNNLTSDELKTMAKVRVSWKDTVDKILAKRDSISWITCQNTAVRFTQHSCNLLYNNVAFGIILYDYTKVNLHTYLCIHQNNLLERKTVVEFVSDEIMPKGIDYCFISCPRINSRFAARHKCFPQGIGKDSIFNGIFLPYIPHVRTAMFQVNPVKKQQMEETLTKYLRSNEEVKCLLLFCKKDLSRSMYNLFDFILGSKDPKTLAVGGGIIRGTKTFQQVSTMNKIHTSSEAFCIAFLQDTSFLQDTKFNAFSYVISGDDLSEQEFEAALIKMKDEIILRKNSVALRVCCSAKFSVDFELDVFENVFPAVPLLSMDAEGEIGWNCLYTTNKEEIEESIPKKRKTKYPRIQHQWSTVFVILTWGDKLAHSN